MIVQQLLFSLLLYPAGGTPLDLGPVSVPGDIILGGLFPVHKKGDRTTCGQQIYHRGVQRLEAMMFAIDRINSNPHILPNITLGVHILDTCSRDTYALNQSLQFVRASVNNIDTSSLECVDHSIPRPRNNYSGPVFGVVGGSYSSVSLQVANLLGITLIPISICSSRNDEKYIPDMCPLNQIQIYYQKYIFIISCKTSKINLPTIEQKYLKYQMQNL
jgi:hypothetical protein